MNEKAKSLYVHIPFCRHLCTYCDFPKVLLRTGFYRNYVPTLLQEDERYEGYGFDTIFIGGGTPSCLPYGELEKLLSLLTQRHGQPKEFSIECNPEDVDDKLAALLKNHGVNRISLGGQTSDKTLLKKLGRTHAFSDVVKAKETFERNGIDNISVDFIYGLFGQSKEQLDLDLDKVKEMKLKHVSFYALQVEPHTVLGIRHKKEQDPDLLGDYYDHVLARLQEMGLERYEVSNFSLPGYESRHNLCYWKGDPYGAIGMGATSYEYGTREVRTKSIEKYLKGEFVSSKTMESLEEQEFDYLMLNLRLREGFSLSDFQRKFDKDFLVDYKDNIQRCKDSLVVEEGRCFLLPDKLYLLDSILVDLLHFPKKE